ncbi:low molecular weight phosphatase family protein [uncultured Microbacterium sp.]|uniref:arsenate reductase/protein-tyrosine-phosphatase family protein n=1 Tax=uncultured Microbacterium sp. TaxID=191216 RepID=UPI00260585B2|nr:low molecular weight phosphatase family protein [uncultured Microbacterium sp.]
MEIMTVCTGNICRSPLAEVLLATRLADLTPAVHSAGVRGLPAATMTPEAVDLAVHFGVPEDVADAHRSRYLTEGMLSSPDLILAMTRDHRRAIAELAPARLRSTFTVREFARLAAAVSDEELLAAADVVGADAGDRIRAAAAVVAAHRGIVPPPADPADDDVIDPYRREWEIYQLSAQQLVPALAEVERVIRLVTP